MRTAALGDLILEAQPGFACGEEDHGGVFQFRMNNVTKSSSLDLSKRRRVPASSHKNIGKFFVRPDDVLFNATNSPDNVGKSVLIPELDEPAVISNHFIRLRTDSRFLIPSFLWRWLQWQFTLGTFSAMCHQWVNQATVSRADLLGLTVPLPSLDEQRRIAVILDHADDLRSKQTRVVEHIARLNEGVFVDMFGTLPSALLGPKLDFITSGGRGWAKYYAPKGEPFVRSLDVRFNSVALDELAYVDAPNNAEAKRTRTQVGDVLLTITGSRIGRAAPVPDHLAGAYVSQHVAILRPKPDEVEPLFLSAFLCSSMFGQRQILGAQYGQTKPGLNFDQIRSFQIPAADAGGQIKFRDTVRHLTKTATRAHAAELEHDALFASLQSRAFSGRL